MEPKRAFVVVLVCLSNLLPGGFSDNGESCKTRNAFKVFARNQNAFQFLSNLERIGDEMEVAIEKPARTMNSSSIFTVPSCMSEKMMTMMNAYQITDFESFNPRFKRQRNLRRLNDFTSPVDPDIVSKRYLSQDEANIYIDDMAARIRKTNPNILVDVYTEGQSYEQRAIKSIFVQYKGRPGNPYVFIDAGIHAREWHSRSMGLYLLKKLAEEAGKDQKGLLYRTSFIIVPLLNPDGYEYSRNGDKLWRKTRRPLKGNCIGVDGNRNYDAHWNEGDRERYPCAEVYKGTQPFSEPETRVVKNIMARMKGRIKMYISIHTYGNTIIYPYGYTTRKHPRQQQLHRIAQAGVNAVRSKTGTLFTANQSGSSLYVAAGGSDDYAIDSGGVPYAFTFELGAEEFGFAVPQERMRKTLEEGAIAIGAMVTQALKM